MRRNFEEYLLDRWNVLDVSALSLCLAAFVVRAVDYDSPWGRSLYALAAPLLYWRVLFYAQLLPFQGAMIQVNTPLLAPVLVMFSDKLFAMAWSVVTRHGPIMG